VGGTGEEEGERSFSIVRAPRSLAMAEDAGPVDCASIPGRIE